MLLTDPPYGVDLGITDIEEAKARHRRLDGLSIENDELQGTKLKDFIKCATGNAFQFMKNGAPFYIWYATSRAKEFIDAIAELDATVREQLIWVKNSLVLGRQDYQWRHEPCLYGWKEGGAHYFIDARTLTTVLDTDIKTISREKLEEAVKELSSITTTIYEDRPTRNELHPTMKPVPLFKKLVRNSSREGDLVLDLFGGSGTTLVACEEMNRKCCMMEYDPHYAEVIIQRWEDLTGEKAYLLK